MRSTRESSDQIVPSGNADRIRGVRVREGASLADEPVKARRYHVGVPGGSDRVPSLLIGEYEKDIGS